MATFTYTGDYSLVFTNLSYGPDVVVTSKSGDVLSAPDGSTVVLEPGDTVELSDQITPFEHAYLVPTKKRRKATTTGDAQTLTLTGQSGESSTSTEGE